MSSTTAEPIFPFGISSIQKGGQPLRSKFAKRVDKNQSVGSLIRETIFSLADCFVNRRGESNPDEAECKVHHNEISSEGFAMYNPVSEINSLQEKSVLVPLLHGVDPVPLEGNASSSVDRAQTFMGTFKPKLELIAKSRISRNQARRKPVSMAGDAGWASMVSHNSGAASAKRRIAKARHKKERLVSNLFQSGDTQRALSELTNAKHLDLLNHILLDVGKMRSTYC